MASTGNENTTLRSENVQLLSDNAFIKSEFDKLSRQQKYQVEENNRLLRNLQIREEKQTYLDKVRAIYSNFITTLELVEDSIRELPSLTALKLGKLRPGSLLDRAELREGDILLEIQGERTNTIGHFTGKLAALAPGDELKLLVSRPGDQRSIHTVNINMQASLNNLNLRPSTVKPQTPVDSDDAPVASLPQLRPSAGFVPISWTVLQAMNRLAQQARCESLLKDFYPSLKELEELAELYKIAEIPRSVTVMNNDSEKQAEIPQS